MERSTTAQKCVSQLYVVMPPLSAVDSLKMIQKERSALVLGLGQDPTNKILLDIVRALLAFGIWCNEQNSATDILCMQTTYMRLLKWATSLWTAGDALLEWKFITSFMQDRLDTDITDIPQITRDVKLNLAIRRSWSSLSDMDWARTLAALPTELVAVLYHWHTVKA